MDRDNGKRRVAVGLMERELRGRLPRGRPDNRDREESGEREI